jgi:hypothetical protein
VFCRVARVKGQSVAETVEEAAEMMGARHRLQLVFEAVIVADRLEHDDFVKRFGFSHEYLSTALQKAIREYTTWEDGYSTMKAQATS